jgi:arylsulfatase A
MNMEQSMTALNQRLISVLTIALLPAVLNASHAANQNLPGRKPNIVLILADDLGYGDLGCFNKGSQIPTPHLDQLARAGMRFTDAHAPASVCSPTRYALLTGRYAWRTRLQRGVLGPWDKPLIAADRLTVASLLQQHGYATACIGKWHLGVTYSTTDGKPPSSRNNPMSNVDFTKPIADGPITRGFDHYFGTFVPNYPPYCFVEDDHTVGIPSVRDTGIADLFNIPGPMAPGWKLVNILPEITRHAEKWIEDAAKSDKPFFLYFPLTSPHYPVVPAPEFKGKSKAGDYGDFVVQTDWTVGRVLVALQRAGVADNTLVIFTSDNGPEVVEINPGAYDRIRLSHHYSMGELRGAKRDTWEGGHRVPFIARWPAKIKAGAASGEIICHLDFMRTVAAILGVQLPDAAAPDSYNLLPVLLGEELDHPVREATVHHSCSGKFAIRKGDWVFINAPSGDDNGAQGEPEFLKRERGYTKHNQPGELFNLRDDISEHRNHYADHPEIVCELKALLEKYKADGRSTAGVSQPNDVSIDAKRNAGEARNHGGVNNPLTE